MEASDDLTVVVVGRAGVGKSLLISHLSQSTTPNGEFGFDRSSRPASQRRSRPPRRPPRLSQRGAASRPSALRLVRIARSVWSAIARRCAKLARRNRPPYSVRRVPSPIQGDRYHHWRVYDVEEHGLFAVAGVATPDLVLFVTRLDESRAAKADRLPLCALEAVFGKSVWSRTICVLTHGHALPPVNLTYTEFLRGRRDALWRTTTLVRPPVPVTDENGDAVTTELLPEDIAPPDGELDWDIEPDQNQEIVVYDDPPAPGVSVVELSDACPTNGEGKRILPDGTVWMEHLLQSVQHLVDHRRDDDSMDLSPALRRLSPVGFTPRGFLRHILRRGMWVLALQVACTVVFLKGFKVTQTWWEKVRKHMRSRRGDVVLKLSDEEYRRVTVKDIEPEPMRNFKPDELDAADDLFFGSESGPESAPSSGDETTEEEDASSEEDVKEDEQAAEP